MNQKKTTVTLEDLLKVKRAERPAAGFWAGFEREMRVKELAAIVEPRPWWAPLIRVGARVTRYQLPVGAAAILALSIVTVREYRTSEMSPAYAPELSASAAKLESSLALAAAPAPAKLETPRPAANQLASEPASESTTVTPAQSAIGQRSHAIALLDAAAAIREPTPSARYIAANLAAVEAADPRMIDNVFGPSVRGVETREPVRDPLAQISTPGDSRRARLLTTSLPVMATAVSVGSSDRVARRLTEERLYDTITRIGLKGDRVAIKF